MVDLSPDAAKARAEKETAGNSAAQKKHLADLKSFFGPNGQYEVAFDQYGNYILVKYLTDNKGNRTAQTQEVFLYVAPDGLGFQVYNATDIVKKVKTDNKGKLEALRKSLYDKDFISESEYLNKDETAFNKAIVLAARNHSVEQVQKYTIENKTKFSPFNSWLGAIKGMPTAGEDTSNLPVRDINLQDRNVIEALVKDIYTRTTDMAIDDAFLKQETDRYMKQIEEGSLTTTTVEGGKIIRKTTPGFSEAQIAAELPGRIKKEQPQAMVPKNSFDFLAFLDGMGARVV